MKLDRIGLRSLSRLGARGTYGIAMLEVPSLQPEVKVLTADLCNTSGLDRFRDQFPSLFYNIGIAEQNMIGIAAGLAKEGFVPFVSTFANFAAMRSYEPMRLNMGYMGFNMKVVGLASGMAMGLFGNTHYGIEDIALMRSMPGNMVVISPADCLEVYKTILACAVSPDPTYIRLTGTANSPMVYKEDYPFEIGKAIQMQKGHNIAVLATGSMVYESLKAAEILAEKGLEVSVYNFHTIKPLDQETLLQICQENDYVATVEEHSVIGGFGSAVAEYFIQRKNPPRQLFIGLPPQFGRAGEYTYLLKHYGLDGQGIAQKIKIFIEEVD
ncbi:transketolase C-terminal domain-containing protein [uncultured Sphaerochaeta sp.]|uniref:transketolase family protein n=1 Tax=uncultured Sphaerochaeta sp. TaxID=886478 RepID=UPI002A0A8573|nr:transketolase C-terminal domain-containing protein [uncultured Sphaerochaeta sp.]